MHVYYHTFGCKANQYDTELVRQSLEAAGASTVDAPELADAAVVNSCTVTHVGEAKMRTLVRRLWRVQPDIKTVVMGCAAALDNGVIAELPGVVQVVRGHDAAAVMRAFDLDAAVDRVLRTFPRGSRAWLKIQDGCDEHCTFCATTLARGAHRSRPTDEIVREAQVLAEQHHELVITGVHIGSYGSEWEGSSLGRLLLRLVNEVARVRFRLSSVEATEVDDIVVDLMRSHPDRLAPHLHAPLQSGSDHILKRMGRHWYSAETYRRRCESIADAVGTVGLGADVMVGFPGETAADHRATVELIRELPFTYLHVFPYSERPGTAAPRLGKPVPAPIVSDRTLELRGLALAKGAEYRRLSQGRIADIVVLRRSRGAFGGLTGDYLDVSIPTSEQLASRFMGVLNVEGNGDLSATPAPDTVAAAVQQDREFV